MWQGSQYECGHITEPEVESLMRFDIVGALGSGPDVELPIDPEMILRELDDVVVMRNQYPELIVKVSCAEARPCHISYSVHR